MRKMNNVLKDKTILLTGGTGSFGNKFTEIALKEHSPKVIRIFSRGEKKQVDMKKKFNDHEKLRFFIGDVRDKNRLNRAINDVDVVIHAAAMKQVPVCEYNPIEAIRTNIDGCINVIDTAIDNNVEKVIFIGTDKAVHPINLYGATKMTSEKLFIQGNSYRGIKNTKFSCVRYGNVIGSRGSVIPIFLNQKKNNILTITDESMTRFWIPLERGVNFVIKSIERMKGGEIFIPKIPSMKIIDLAKTIAPDAKIKIIGIRPGEKIHEILLTEDESRHSREFDDYYIIEPELEPKICFWKPLKSGKNLENGFRYTSESNNKWITKDEITKIIEEFK